MGLVCPEERLHHYKPQTIWSGGDRLSLDVMETTCPITDCQHSIEVGTHCFEEKEAISSHISPDLCVGLRRSRQVGKDLVTGEVTRGEKVYFVKDCKLDSDFKPLPQAMCALKSLNHISSSSQIEGERLHGSKNQDWAVLVKTLSNLAKHKSAIMRYL